MAGIDAFGTIWAVEFTPPTFTTIADVTSIDVLDIEVDTIDVSSHSSVGQWREFVAGMKDAGELSMEINYDPAVHGTIFAEIGAAAKRHKITLPDSGAATVEFNAIVTGFTTGAPYDDKLTGTITLKVTGAITITP
jgi:predicted secreted protein